MRMNPKSSRLRIPAVIAAAVLMFLTGAVRYYADSLPDHFYAEISRPLTVETALPVTIRSKAASEPPIREAEVRLFGMIPVKTVSLTAVSPTSVCVGGQPFGIRMLMAGVMVVSLGEIPELTGRICPATDAGIEIGDVICAVNGKEIGSNTELQEAVSASGGNAVQIRLLRGNAKLDVTVQPVYSPLTQRWQTGMWVRDSTAGIGTVTYYYPDTGGNIQFAGLGHAVCDADTGEQIPLASGDVLAVSVRDILTGSAGKPGELRGKFNTASALGTLSANTASGVFGTVHALPAHPQFLPLGFRQDIETGDAVIYTTPEGSIPKAFSAEIEEIRGDDPAMRNLIIRVTDPALLEKTGGIVQGMSGSPIIQNGKLVGAVTHVFVKDPTRGYGIFAENMFAQTAALADAAA